MARKDLMSFFVVVAVLHATTAAESCSMSQSTMEKAVMACAATQPMLMLEIAEHMQNPRQMESLKFVCSNQGAMVEMMLCLEKKFVKCLPLASQHILNSLLPDEKHMKAGVKLMCEKQDLFSMSCMTPEVSQEFAQCYMASLQGIMGSFDVGSEAMIKEGFCSVIHSDESCFRLHHGTCSNKLVESFIELIETFFPTESCKHSSKVTETDRKQDLKNSLRGILLRGSPLMYKSEGAAPYNIAN